jgi:GNAT superfamily N-acetyltransferase
MTQHAAGSAFVRPATRDDLPTIVAMRDDLNRLELHGTPHAPIQPFSLAEFTALWGHTFDSPKHCWRILEVDGQPAGFGLIYLMTPPTGAYLHWAYVDPARRRHGLGRRLLDELVSWARSHGTDRVELRFIEGNDIARQFWTKMGFRPYARTCVYYLGDASSNSSR